MPTTFQNPSVRHDMVFLRRLRQPDFQVLVDIQPNEIKRVVEDKGSVIPTCADGDEIYELMTHHRQICDGSNCHHSPALNGGPLLFSDLLLNEEMRGDGAVLLRHSFEGRKLKGVETFVCYGHAPCGKARLNGIRADELIGHYINGKDRVRRHATRNEIPLKAVCLWIHIHWPNDDQRTYVFKRDAWNKSEVVAFRQEWHDHDFRQRMVDVYWDTYWPTLKVA